jgi:hypothetical protein
VDAGCVSTFDELCTFGDWGASLAEAVDEDGLGAGEVHDRVVAAGCDARPVCTDKSDVGGAVAAYARLARASKDDSSDEAVRDAPEFLTPAGEDGVTEDDEVSGCAGEVDWFFELTEPASLLEVSSGCASGADDGAVALALESSAGAALSAVAASDLDSECTDDFAAKRCEVWLIL